MKKTLGIIQSNYIPWKGYFDLINTVDEFILFDSVEYSRGDWRNRNKIKTPRGAEWLSIPVRVSRQSGQKISSTKVSNPNWGRKHWGSIQANYAKSAYFRQYADPFRNLYENPGSDLLSEINKAFILLINDILGIRTKISDSSDYDLVDGRNEKLIGLCKQTNSDTYLSGPAAKEYIDEEAFAAAGINVHWMDYSGYPEYGQLFPPFEHAVSILDLIFNQGPTATQYMKSFEL